MLVALITHRDLPGDTALIILNYKLLGLEHVIRHYWKHCKHLARIIWYSSYVSLNSYCGDVC